MSFPRYPKYKDSGVEWLGQVPEHWNSGSVRWLTRRYAGGTPDKTNFSFWDNGTVPWINSGSVNDRLIKEPSAYITEAALENSSARWIPEGSLVMALAGQGKTKGMVAQLGIPTTCNQSMAAIVPGTEIGARFLLWWLESNYENIRNLAGGDLRDGLNLELVGNISCPLPTKPEQTAIAEFLDRETAKIDVLIAEQQRLMELLKEKRQAVISHAVTKGLNPNAPMKPSGIEWFAEVPHHWQQGPLKRYWEVIDCKHVTVPFLEQGIPVASVMEVRSFELDLSQALKTSEESFRLLSDGGRQPVCGDVIYCRNTANTGTSAFVGTEQKIALGQDVCLIKSSGRNGRYLNYILHSGFMAAQLDTLMVGSTFKRINVAEIRGLLVPCPPKPEQDGIAVFLDVESAKFDTLIAEAQRAIDLLQERRSALISAAVTGQIDVRNT